MATRLGEQKPLLDRRSKRLIVLIDALNKRVDDIEIEAGVAPDAPASISVAAVADGTVNVTIGASPTTAVDAYRIYRRQYNVSPADYVLIAQINGLGNTPHYNDDYAFLTVGVVYEYVATAVVSSTGGESVFTSTLSSATIVDTTAPSFSGSSINAQGAIGKCEISWDPVDANTDDIDYYAVSCNYSKNGDTNSPRAVGNYQGTTAIDYDLTATAGAGNEFSAFTYTITAHDNLGNTASIGPTAVTIANYAPADGTVPAVPGTLTATPDDDGRVVLTWVAPTGPPPDMKEYQIDRTYSRTTGSISIGATYETIAIVDSTASLIYTDSGLNPNIVDNWQYQYRIWAVDTMGNRSATASSSATVKAVDTTGPTAPTPTAAGDTGFITVSWSDADTSTVLYHLYVEIDNTGAGAGGFAGSTLLTSISGNYNGSAGTLVYDDVQAKNTGYYYRYTLIAQDAWGNKGSVGSPSSSTISPLAIPRSGLDLTISAPVSFTSVNGTDGTILITVTGVSVDSNKDAYRIYRKLSTEADFVLIAQIDDSLSVDSTIDTTESIEIDETDISITSGGCTEFYSDDYITIDNEVMKITNCTSVTSILAVVRAQMGTSQTTHLSGADIFHTTPYVDDDSILESTKTYNYELSAYDVDYGIESSRISTTAATLTDTIAPVFSSGSVDIQGAIGRAIISWPAVTTATTDLDYYKVNCNFSKNGNTEATRLVGNFEGTTASDYDLTATADEFEDFVYQIIAYDFDGNTVSTSTTSATFANYQPADGGKPGAVPGTPTAVADEDGRIDIAWLASGASDIKEYQIERTYSRTTGSISIGDTYETIAVVNATADRIYTDSGLNPNIVDNWKYQYRIWAIDNMGNKSATGTSTATEEAVDTTGPAAPTPTATAGTGFITVSWSDADTSTVLYHLYVEIDTPIAEFTSPSLLTTISGNYNGSAGTLKYDDVQAKDTDSYYRYTLIAEDAWGNKGSAGSASGNTVGPNAIPRAGLELTLDPPNSVAAVNGTDGTVTVTVTDTSADTDTDSYRIYRKTSTEANSLYKLVGQVDGLVFVDDDPTLVPHVPPVTAITYDYIASAMDTTYGIESATTVKSSIIVTDTGVPGFSSGSIDAQGATGRCIITWPPVNNTTTDLDFYLVECNRNKDGSTPGSDREVGNFEGTTANDYDLTATAGAGNQFSAFTYKVTATDNQGNTASKAHTLVDIANYLPADGTIPAVPGTVSNAPDNDGGIKLTWVASISDDVSHYEIDRTDDAQTKWENIASTASAADLQFTDRGLVPFNSPASKVYQYRIWTIDTMGNRSASASLSAVGIHASDNTPPSPPTPTATAANNSMITVSWDDQADTDRWHIHFATSTNAGSSYGSYQEIIILSGQYGGDAGTIQYNHGQRVVGSVYKYKLKAEDRWGNVSDLGTASAGHIAPLNYIDSADLGPSTLPAAGTVMNEDGIYGRYGGATTFFLNSTTGDAEIGDAAHNQIVIATSGIYWKYNGVVKTSLVDSTLTLGPPAAEHIVIDGTCIDFMSDASTTKGSLNGDTWILGTSTAYHTEITNTTVQLKNGSTVLTSIAGGNVTIGNPDGGTDANKNIKIEPNAVKFLEGTDNIIEISTQSNAPTLRFEDKASQKYWEFSKDYNAVDPYNNNFTVKPEIDSIFKFAHSGGSQQSIVLGIDSTDTEWGSSPTTKTANSIVTKTMGKVLGNPVNSVMGGYHQSYGHEELIDLFGYTLGLGQFMYCDLTVIHWSGEVGFTQQSATRHRLMVYKDSDSHTILPVLAKQHSELYVSSSYEMWGTYTHVLDAVTIVPAVVEVANTQYKVTYSMSWNSTTYNTELVYKADIIGTATNLTNLQT